MGYFQCLSGTTYAHGGLFAKVVPVAHNARRTQSNSDLGTAGRRTTTSGQPKKIRQPPVVLRRHILSKVMLFLNEASACSLKARAFERARGITHVDRSKRKL